MAAKKDTYSQILDEKSENIVYLLSIDSRMPVADVAEALGLKRNQVDRRLQRLLREGFVKYYTVNNAAAGFRATILLRLRRIDEELLTTFQSIPSVRFVRETLGVYDLQLVCFVSSREELDALVQKVGKLAHGRILRFDVLPHDWTSPLGYKAFCHNQELLQRFRFTVPGSRKVSAREQEILEALKKQPVASYRELAKSTGTGFRTLREALDGLRKDGLVRFSVFLNYPKLGLQYDYMLCQAEPSRRAAFEKYLVSHPRVHWVKRGQGRWEYVISIVSRNNAELIDTTWQLRA